MMPGNVWSTLCYIAGAISIVGPLFLIYFYFQTVRKRLREFNK
jgi:hypothetical protein